MNRPAGLAVVGYGLTLVGFIQVAYTIAPRIADSIPEAGTAAHAVGVAIALAIDICWAALMHTTLTTYRNGQPLPALGFGAATALAVAASTILLASVGHMGPWSLVPAIAALLLVADGIREHVSVSPETAAVIRQRTADIRDSRALARIEARHDAHAETITGYRESARLAARTAALADIRVTVQRADFRANKRVTRATERFAIDGESAGRLTEQISIQLPESAESPAVIHRSDQPNQPSQTKLSIVPAATEDDLVNQILDLARQNVSQRRIAEMLGTNQSRVGRVIRANSA